jgi:hypothetical protein
MLGGEVNRGRGGAGEVNRGRGGAGEVNRGRGGAGEVHPEEGSTDHRCAVEGGEQQQVRVQCPKGDLPADRAAMDQILPADRMGARPPKQLQVRSPRCSGHSLGGGGGRNFSAGVDSLKAASFVFFIDGWL